MTNTVIALLTAGAIVATSCGRNEPDFEDVADRALESAGLQAADADYDSDAKVVHVTGTVVNSLEVGPNR